MPDDFTVLAMRYLDGLTGEREDAELRRMLAGSAQYRQEFVELCRRHGRMSEVLRADANVAPAPARRIRVRRRPVRWGWWVSVAACLAIVVGALLYNEQQVGQIPQELIARVRTVTGDVTVLRDGQTAIAVVGQGIEAGDVLRTRPTGYVEFAYEGERTLIAADGDTGIEIGDTARGKRLHLRRGVMRVTAGPQPNDKPMVVTTKHATAEVVGTKFRLAANDQKTRLDVTEGVVRFSDLSKGTSIDVAAGGSATTGGTTLIAYRKGAAILSDDFEETDMSNWDLTFMGQAKGSATLEHDRSKKAPGLDRCLRFERAETLHGMSRVAVLDAVPLKGKTVVLAPREDGREGHQGVLIEFERRVLGEGAHVGHLFIHEGEKDETVIRRAQKIVPTWERVRIEIVGQKDENGEWYRDIKMWQGDRLVEHRKIRGGGNAVCGFGVQKGQIMIDNFVLRELVPVTAPDRKEGADVR